MNRRINDAWGVRDIIRSGGLRTGEFESWMAKVRDDSTAVFPPLPADSPYRGRHEKRGVYAPAHAKYGLRPFPSSAFPLFIVKNFEEPMTGGRIANRIYLKDHRVRDFGYNAMYTKSASRWIDGYFAVGFEIDEYDVEGGTEFWGIRFGIKYRDIWEFDRIGYVVEFGAGVW